MQKGGIHPFIGRAARHSLQFMATRSVSQAGSPITFIVERYWPDATEQGLAEAAEAARRAAVVVSAEGRLIRLVDAFIAREDQVVLTLFEADSRASVREVTERAGLPFDRITEVDRPHLHPAADTQRQEG